MVGLAVVVSVSLWCCDVLVAEVGSKGDSRDSETGEHGADASRTSEQGVVAPGVVLCPRILERGH